MQRFSWPAEELLAPQKGFCTVELFTEGSRPSVILDTSLVWSDPTRPLYSFPYRYIHFHTAIPIAISLYSLPYRYTHCQNSGLCLHRMASDFAPDQIFLHFFLLSQEFITWLHLLQCSKAFLVTISDYIFSGDHLHKLEIDVNLSETFSLSISQEWPLTATGHRIFYRIKILFNFCSFSRHYD